MSICLLKEEWSPPTGMIVPKAHRRLKRPMEISVYVRGNFVTCQKNFTAAHIDLKPGLTGGEDRNKVKACILVRAAARLRRFSRSKLNDKTVAWLFTAGEMWRDARSVAKCDDGIGNGRPEYALGRQPSEVLTLRPHHFADFRIIHSLSITCKNSIRPKNSHVFNHPVTSTSYSAFRGKR